jgi:ATP-dependent Lhr-like helicase
MLALESFHPSVRAWFLKQFSAPTEPQSRAWPAIKQRKHTLIAAPTGSGKTLAAFLSAIDDLVWKAVDGKLIDETQVVYVSPLKALSNDIQINLQAPLRGIQEKLKTAGFDDIEVRTLVRTGDTPASERAAMTKKPPHVVVTTPESLYILLTSEGGRRMLKTTRTLIVDEIHAMVDDKRGSHLSLSIERLQALVKEPLVRIGLSATQKPIAEVARFLVGAANIDTDGAP